MSLNNLEKNLYRKDNKKFSKKNIPKENTINIKPSKEGDFKTEAPWGGNNVFVNNGNNSKISNVIQKYGKVVMFISIALIVIMSAFSGYYLYQFFKSKDIHIDMNSSADVLSGDVFNVSVVISNTSSKNLLDPVISLSLPDGAIYSGNSSKRIIEYNIDTIAPGETIKKDFDVAIVGESSKIYEFNGAVLYKYNESSVASVFEANSSIKVLARAPVLAIDISAPEKIINGEDFEVKLSYQNSGEVSLVDPRIKFDIPDDFSIQGSDPKLKNNEFILKNIEPNNNGTAIFSGSMIAKEYSFFSISVDAEVNIGGKYYTINQKTNSISILPSPLSISIEPQKGGGIVYPGDNLQYRISYMNNSDIVMHDVVLSVQLFGSMFDISKLTSNGFLDTNTNTIIWTASEVPQLQELGVKETGYISFNVPLLETYPSQRISDKNFIVKVKGKIISPTLLSGVSAQHTMGLSDVQNKVGGAIKLLEPAYFNEQTVNISNQGALPPKVNTPIEYTIHFLVNANGTDFKNVKLNAFLASGVSWTGKVVSNIKSVPTYNDRTKEISWDIGDIASNSGFDDANPYAVFQIRITPSSSQTGRKLSLISRGDISGIDAFTGKETNEGIESINSYDLSDMFLPERYDRVTQ